MNRLELETQVNENQNSGGVADESPVALEHGSLAGRELDTAVAERVMGEPKPTITGDCEDPINDRRISSVWLHVHYYERGDECEVEARPFSTDIAAAMEVVEKLLALDYEFDLMKEGDERLVCVMNPAGAQFWQPGALPEAICRAALAAVESRERANEGTE